jgi:hypothetical protein
MQGWRIGGPAWAMRAGVRHRVGSEIVKLGLKLAAGAAALAMTLGAAQASQAAVVDWTLSNGTFDDGGTFFGTFTVDTVADTITDWNVTTQGSVGANYGPGAGGFGAFNDAFDSGSGPSFLQGIFIFGLVFNLTNIPLGGPGSVAHLTGSETLFIGGDMLGSRIVTDGQAVGVLAGGVPEPATWSMIILGAGLAGASLRRSRRAALAT